MNERREREKRREVGENAGLVRWRGERKIGYQWCGDSSASLRGTGV
jgi:hypothetical protein